MTTFANQVALVSGASSGIGRAIALGLAADGATVCLVGRKLQTLEVVAEEGRTTGCRVLSYEADLTVDKDIQDVAEKLRRDVGALDVLVHSAGVISLGRLETEPVRNLDWQYRTNVRAPYTLTQALLPMLKARRGQIVFVNSLAGLSARESQGPYAATKHALKAIADSLRAEVGAEGIRVLSVFLGKTATPMQEYVHKVEGRAYRPERLLQPEDVASVVINALRLPRTAEVTDITMGPSVGLT
jgi:NADP-dependent 3-hydroxy acid dehydrogenase YdfG